MAWSTTRSDTQSDLHHLLLLPPPPSVPGNDNNDNKAAMQKENSDYSGRERLSIEIIDWRATSTSVKQAMADVVHQTSNRRSEISTQQVGTKLQKVHQVSCASHQSHFKHTCQPSGRNPRHPIVPALVATPSSSENQTHNDHSKWDGEAAPITLQEHMPIIRWNGETNTYFLQ